LILITARALSSRGPESIFDLIASFGHILPGHQRG
jgi:hypothetical protein